SLLADVALVQSLALSLAQDFFSSSFCVLTPPFSLAYFFFFNDTATPQIYTLSLHDALPISSAGPSRDATLAETSSSFLYRTPTRSEEHTSELQSQSNLVCRLLLEKKKKMLQPTAYIMDTKR